MKKSSLARLQQQASELEQVNDSYLEKMISIFEATFSAIATAEPKIALSIIDQISARKEEIEKMGEERAANAEMYVKRLASMMPPVIEFEDEDEDN